MLASHAFYASTYKILIKIFLDFCLHEFQPLFATLSYSEIFILHATLDSNWRGLAVLDNSYVSIDGTWAASSLQDNIWVSPQSTDALLVITGGTIFNAG